MPYTARQFWCKLNLDWVKLIFFVVEQCHIIFFIDPFIDKYNLYTRSSLIYDLDIYRDLFPFLGIDKIK